VLFEKLLLLLPCGVTAVLLLLAAMLQQQGRSW
jgi:hypothetical protein